MRFVPPPRARAACVAPPEGCNPPPPGPGAPRHPCLVCMMGLRSPLCVRESAVPPATVTPLPPPLLRMPSPYGPRVACSDNGIVKSCKIVRVCVEARAAREYIVHQRALPTPFDRPSQTLNIVSIIVNAHVNAWHTLEQPPDTVTALLGVVNLLCVMPESHMFPIIFLLF